MNTVPQINNKKAVEHKMSLRHRLAAFTLGFAAATLLMVTSGIADEKAPEPYLKERIQVFGDVVRLEDLFENAGKSGRRAVFRAPDLGQNGFINAVRLQKTARRYGLEWPNHGAIDTVLVSRASKQFTKDDIKTLIRDEIARQQGLENVDNLTVKLHKSVNTIHTDPRSTTPPEVKSLDHNKTSGRFRAVITTGDALHKGKDHIIRGEAFKAVEIPLPTITLKRGVTIKSENLKLAKFPANQLGNDIAVDIEAMIGMAPKRTLTAGQPVRKVDLIEPKLVKKGDIVSIEFQLKGLSLKTEGRALSDGALGQTIDISNLQSNRTVQAKIIGHNRATVSPHYRPKKPKLLKTSRAQVEQSVWQTVYSVAR